MLFGYKRLGKNLENAISAGLQFARGSGVITSIGGNKFELAKSEESMSANAKTDNLLAPQQKIVSNPKCNNLNVECLIPEGQKALYAEGGDYKAVAIKAGVDFIVLKGSKISNSIEASCPDAAVKTREKYADIIGSDYILLADIKFSSPSGAASFVAGSSRNGYTEWKNEDGIMLKNIK